MTGRLSLSEQLKDLENRMVVAESNLISLHNAVSALGAELPDRGSEPPTLPPVAQWPLPGRWQFSRRSIERMTGIHPDLLAVAHYALRICSVDFGVTRTGGLRTEITQAALVEAGKSKTLNSRHRTGHALDVVAFDFGRAQWGAAYALTVHQSFVRAAKVLGVALRWGGDWDGDGDTRDETFVDMFHHELPRSMYGVGMDPGAAASVFLDFVQGSENTRV